TIEVGASILRRETQIGRANFDQFSTNTSSRELQWRIRTRADDEVGVRWQVLEQKADASVDLLTFDDVVVVENDINVVGLCRQLVQQNCEQRSARSSYDIRRWQLFA